MGNQDKRKYQRFLTSTNAKVRDLQTKKWKDVVIINLSKGGARIQGPPFEISEMVEVFIPSNHPKFKFHHFLAMVAWIEKDNYGVEFLSRL